MTDPHRPFLRTIIADKADDAPRLVYADWLEENGEPARAEFIRLQIRLAALPPARKAVGVRNVALGRPRAGGEFDFTAYYPGGGWSRPAGMAIGDIVDVVTDKGVRFDGCLFEGVVDRGGGGIEYPICQFRTGKGPDPSKGERERLAARERELERAVCTPGGKTNSEWWFSPFDEEFTHTPGDFGDRTEKAFCWHYRRGFVAHVHLAWSDWLAHADALLAATPLEAVELSSRPPEGAIEPWIASDGWRCRIAGRERFHFVLYGSADHCREALEAEWPGIAFTLPPYRTTTITASWSNETANIPELLRGLREQMERGGSMVLPSGYEVEYGPARPD